MAEPSPDIAPDVAIALSRVENDSVILALWLPMAIFGHIFAGVFLIHGLFLYKPSLKRNSKRAAGGSPLREAALGYDGGDGDGDGNGTSGPSQVSLEWRSLSLTVVSPSSPGGLTPVLRDVGGRAPAGAVTALLGPSGAGKSTLLDLLAVRGAVAVPEGQQPPQPPQPPQPLAHSGALQPGCSGQFDAFLPQLTVREALLFTGRLVLPPPQCQPRAVADRSVAVATALGLAPSMDSLVGGVLPGGLLLRGLSGGERKRLSIGQGLMSRPRVLLLDEPTSGLDSFAATVVMGHVAELARGRGGRGGVTVIASLHQPRAAIWDMVNQVVVLGRGRLLYCGPPSELLPWFSGRLGYCYRPEHHGLVSDWVMDLVAMTVSDPRVTDAVAAAAVPAAEAKAAVAAGASWQAMKTDVDDTGAATVATAATTAKSQDLDDSGGGGGGGGSGTESSWEAPSGPEVMATLAELNAAADAFANAVLAVPPAPGVSAGVPDYANVPPPRPRKSAAAALAAAAGRWVRQYRMLVWREWLIATRNPADAAGRMLTFVWVALFAAFLAYDLESDATSIFLRSTLLFAMVFFFLVMPFVFMSLFAAGEELPGRVNCFHTSGSIYWRPQLRGGVGGLYDPYGMIGYRHSVLAAVQNTTCAVLMSLISLQFIQFAVAITPNQDLAFCTSVGFVVLNLLLSTQFLGTLPYGKSLNPVRHRTNPNAVKLFFSWIRRLRALSALDHSWRGLMWAEFHNRAFECGPAGTPGFLGTDALGLLPEFLPDNRRFRMIAVGMTQSYDNCVVDTNALLSNFGINVPVGTTVGYLFAYWAVLHLITYLSLRHAVSHKAGSATAVAAAAAAGGLLSRLRRAVGAGGGR
ncbi:hypothetical protein VOLCADRAFT_91098 [Volvox carteri f. nagariensis]|uniref:ABC transporter domain-containing protein n=2 Tax=Volvox carteri f. nagariensis TaxID=3068 RepID=D8TW62_VOLCA|nr:uncharacterized protein VOLCADRAFT_91098 [Volvox carteri f. nagariensis]EFJ48316.1 hypothetical protein VOLCADRAFT_91098 [Volvox carteri f. nagariensis]|eukprot:XP_002950570.1 hypothetical protein VOLCADRAFT_91098 [Volvox carteri f. nagariensis]